MNGEKTQIFLTFSKWLPHILCTCWIGVLLTETIAVCSEIHTKQIRALWEKLRAV